MTGVAPCDAARAGVVRAARVAAIAFLVPAAFLAIVMLPPVPPALGHPGGPPPQAHLSAEGDTVTVRLTAEPDDAAVMLSSLGLVDPEVPSAYLDADASLMLDVSESREVSADPVVSAYLAEHVRVSQDGTPCEPEVMVDDLIHDGALIVYSCPSSVTVVQLEITILFEDNPAYRTFGVAEDGVPDLTVFTTLTPVHEFDFSGAGGAGEAADRPADRAGGVAWWGWTAGGVTAGALLVAALWWWRRRS